MPSIGGRELDLCKLFKAVYVRGGSMQVSQRKLWKEIVNEFQIPSSCTSASFTLRNHYNKCLLAYEERYFQQNSPELIVNSGGLAFISGPGPGRPVGSGNNSSHHHAQMLAHQNQLLVAAMFEQPQLIPSKASGALSNQ